MQQPIKQQATRSLLTPKAEIIFWWAVISLVAFIRIRALNNLSIINPDGIIYIYQAKAIASGQWDLLNQCQLPYVSLYPFLIAFFHLFTPSWATSAQWVSFCCGMGMLAVLYPLLRQSFDPAVSRLTTLLFALTPLLVRYSADAMRDATFWFFFLASMLAFVVHSKQLQSPRRSFFWLLTSSVFILLAAWSRIEGLVLLPAACLCIVLAQGERKMFRLLTVLLPFLLLALAGGSVLLLYGVDVFNLIRLDEVADKFIQPIASYRELRQALKTLFSGYGFSLLGNFLETSYHVVWLIALGSILSNAMESYFYPYVPFYLLGGVVFCTQSRRRSDFLYILLIIGASFVLLCAHVVQTWVMTYRFIALLLLPSCLFAGLGIQTALGWLAARPQWNPQKAFAMVAAFIVLASLPKNMRSIEDDKAVYPQIGQAAAQLVHNQLPVGIAGRRSIAHNWIVFYANADSTTPLCYHDSIVTPGSVAALEQLMRARNIQFFLWEEFAWKKCSFGHSSMEFQDRFEEMGRWRHEDTGTLILFRLKGEHEALPDA